MYISPGQTPATLGRQPPPPRDSLLECLLFPNISPEFAEFTNRKFIIKRTIRTYNLLCKRTRWYHIANKTHATDMILKVILIHASVIYQSSLNSMDSLTFNSIPFQGKLVFLYFILTKKSFSQFSSVFFPQRENLIREFFI